MSKIEFVDYGGESDLSDVIALIEKDLSEPYSIFTYRYFINNWSRLCINVRNARRFFSSRFITVFEIRPNVMERWWGRLCARHRCQKMEVE